MKPAAKLPAVDGCAVSHDAEAITMEFRDYVYGVSHDISAPVRAMVEFSRLLTTEHANGLNKEGQLYLSLIIESGEKLQNMMVGLLDYSRLNTEARPFATVNCNAAFDQARTLLADKIKKTDAVVDCEALPEIEGDARQIEQLLAALLDNALKFQSSADKPNVKIAAQPQGEGWRFSVADNGIGIDPRYQKKIFHIFQRLQADKDYPGTGMGLTLAQKIVHRHGGEIWVESVPGQGAVFYFTLPAAHS
jgi:light-regulated signal transduction histidine kinase (bacteriophytochrome)